MFAEIEEVGETEITSLDPGLTIRRPDLDEAVRVAYGWTDEPDDAEVLARLLRLNLEREAVE